MVNFFTAGLFDYENKTQKENKEMRHKLLCISLMVIFSLSASIHLYADEREHPPKDTASLETITVTANKMEEDPQEIPQSISVLSEVDIQDRSIEQTSDVFARMPNMHMMKMGPMGLYSTLNSIRGISTFMSGDPVFGFIVDDVFFPSPEINLLDVERIEVLRGPQGTLYGKNTEAGVINIITKAPQNEWSGDLGVTYGNYNTIETYLNGGGAVVKDKLFLRFAGKFSSYDGYYTNTVDNDEEVNEGETYDGRISLLYTPSEKLKVDLKVNLQSYDSNYADFATYDKVMNGDGEVSVNDPGDSDRDFSNGSLKIAYDMGNIRLTSITTALDDESVNKQDMDFTSLYFYATEFGMGYSLYTQELRLNSLSKTSPLKWTAGVYLYSGEEDRNYIFDMIPYGVKSEQYGNTDSTGAAVFGQANYTMDRLVITAGLRYEHEEKDFDYEWKGGAIAGYIPCSGSSEKTFEALLPKFALSYHFADNFLPYASISRGFKSGGFNLNGDPGTAYDSEFTWNYEVGVKSEFADNRVRLNLALFYINWEDLQVEQTLYPNYVVDNAGEATSKGVELEVTFYPVTGFEIYGSLGYVDATFDEYVNDGVDYAGKTIPNTPHHTYNLGATYRFLEHWMVNAEVNGTGSIYFEEDNKKSQNSYEIVNLKAGYEADTFDIYLWAKNLFDEAYTTRAFEMANVMTYASEWWARTGDPLTFGITFRYRF